MGHSPARKQVAQRRVTLAVAMVLTAMVVSQNAARGFDGGMVVTSLETADGRVVETAMPEETFVADVSAAAAPDGGVQALATSCRILRLPVASENGNVTELRTETPNPLLNPFANFSGTATRDGAAAANLRAQASQTVGGGIQVRAIGEMGPALRYDGPRITIEPKLRWSTTGDASVNFLAPVTQFLGGGGAEAVLDVDGVVMNQTRGTRLVNQLFNENLTLPAGVVSGGATEDWDFTRTTALRNADVRDNDLVVFLARFDILATADAVAAAGAGADVNFDEGSRRVRVHYVDLKIIDNGIYWVTYPPFATCVG